jgi:hypothetical protein
MNSILVGMTAFCITTIIFMTMAVIYANKYHQTLRELNILKGENKK